MRHVIWLQNICRKNNTEFTDEQANQMESYVSLLLQLNHQINLISRKDAENVWERHILHSISPLFTINLPGDFTILDLGTGGGLPGIPLKIMFPSLEFTLVDSVQKKIKAVSEMIQTLKLTHVTTIWSRAEELSKMPEFKQRFDVVICRAVAPLKELIKWSEPLLKAGSDRNGIKHEKKGKQTILSGTLIAFKGGNLQKEIDNAKLYKNVRSVEEIQLTFNGSESLSLTDKKLILVRP